MTFNETNVNRDQSGKFDHKVGSTAEVELPDGGLDEPDFESRLALAAHFEVDIRSVEASEDLHYDHLPTFRVDDEEYAFGTEEQAQSAAKTYIGESLWAVRSEALAEQTGLSRDVFRALQDKAEGGEKFQEDIERLVANLSDGGVDGFAERCIEQDGRGTFLSMYDGEETKVEYGDKTYYLYRTN